MSGRAGRVPCPNVVLLGEPPLGWLWGEEGPPPEPSRVSLQRAGVRPRVRVRKAWLKSQSEMALERATRARKLYLRCEGCGCSKPANPYTIRPDVMERLKCAKCGGRVRRIGLPPVEINDHARYYQERRLGGWVEKLSRRRTRLNNPNSKEAECSSSPSNSVTRSPSGKPLSS